MPVGDHRRGADPVGRGVVSIPSGPHSASSRSEAAIAAPEQDGAPCGVGGAGAGGDSGAVGRLGRWRRSGRRGAPAIAAIVLLVLALVASACGGDAGGLPGAGVRSGGGSGAAVGGTGEQSSATTVPPSPDVLFDAVCGGSPEVSDTGTIEATDITEASGLVASWANTGNGADGAWWVHNDSGDEPRIFAVDVAGRLLATVELLGAEARDWEDVAVAPPAAPGGAPQLYVGDIGNNQMRLSDTSDRRSVRIYRLDEPTVPTAPPADGADVPALTAKVTSFTLRYPDGPHDAEAMVVDPVTGELYLVTKDWRRTGQSLVFSVANPSTIASGASVTLTAAGAVPLEPGRLVTAADVTRDGSIVALRSYGAVDLYRRPAGQALSAAFETTPCEGPTPPEFQGESLGFASDGGSYLTLSEGFHPTLHRTSP